MLVDRRILIVSDSLPTPSFKRSGIFARDDYKYFKECGYLVKVLILHRRTFERRNLFAPIKQIKKINTQLNELRQIESDNPNIEVLSYYSLIKPFVYKEDLFLFKNSRFANVKFDVVIVHSMLHAGLNIDWIKRQFPFSKIILKEHSDWALYPSLIRTIAISKIARYNEVWANSKATKKSFEKIFSAKKKIDNLPFVSVDYPKFHLNTDFIDKASFETIRVLTVANLVKEKGYEEAFEILKIINKHFKKWEWKIIGHGVYKNRILELATQYGFESNLHIIDEVEKPALYDHYKSANLYLQLSYQESFGISPIEAFSYFNKLIVSDKITSINELELDKNNNVLLIKDLSRIKDQENQILYFIRKRFEDENLIELLKDINNKINKNIV